MPLDWPNLAAGGVIGFVAGFLANEAYAQHHARRAASRLRKKFGHIAGSYVGYAFAENTDDIDYGNPIGKCEIAYKGENVFLLRYEEIRAPNIWEAAVWMETPFFGSMAWRYVKLGGRQPPPEHRHGFKRCLVSEVPDRAGNMKTYFYLLGEPPFGREALEKND